MDFLIIFVLLNIVTAIDSLNSGIGPIPYPKSLNISSFVFAVPNTISITTNSQFCNILDDSIKRFYVQTFENSIQTTAVVINPKGKLKSIEITLLTTCLETTLTKEWPSELMDESYTIKTDAHSIKLTSNQVWGALHGLETLSQLIYRDATNTILMNSSYVIDSPRFSHRGVLLDSARHFIPIDKLKLNLDAMAATKMNVFHWHIVDDESFPYTSRVFPDLSGKGSFAPQTHVYTQNDISEIMEYARKRGIRVVPEFDTPGHSLSWGKGYPDLLTPCYSSGKPSGKYGPMDPSKNSTYQFLSKFMGEVTDFFADNYLHLGGDEVPFGCWQSNPQIQAFMKQMKFGTDFAKLEEFYMNELIKSTLASKPPKKTVKLVVWQEVFDNKVNVPHDTLIHVWKGKWQSEMSSVTKKGYTTLLSSCWYLDYISYGSDWTSYYACDPHEFNGTDAQKTLVKGGEACVWGEMVDYTNVISRAWPRAAAVAERLWSDASIKDVAQMTSRMHAFKCRLNKRGIHAEPVARREGFCFDNQQFK